MHDPANSLKSSRYIGVKSDKIDCNVYMNFGRYLDMKQNKNPLELSITASATVKDLYDKLFKYIDPSKDNSTDHCLM